MLTVTSPSDSAAPSSTVGTDQVAEVEPAGIVRIFLPSSLAATKSTEGSSDTASSTARAEAGGTVDEIVKTASPPSVTGLPPVTEISGTDGVTTGTTGTRGVPGGGRVRTMRRQPGLPPEMVRIASERQLRLAQAFANRAPAASSRWPPTMRLVLMCRSLTSRIDLPSMSRFPVILRVPSRTSRSWTR